MPTVPMAQRQVATAPLSNARESADAPAAAFEPPAPTDLSGAAQFQTRQAIDDRNSFDQIAISDADAKLVRAKTARLWDPQTGAMNARGKEAIPAGDQAQAGFQDDAAAIEAGLATDRQKEAFRQRANMHYADLGGQLGQHVATQLKQFDFDTTEGHVGALTDAAVKSYRDEPSVQGAIDNVRAVETDYWRRNGHADGAGVDDFAKQHIADRVSAIRAAVFEQYSNAGDDQSASAYFEAHKADFTGRDYLQVEKVADAGSTRAKGQRAAFDIVHAAPTLSAAMAEVEKITDPRVQDDAARRVRQHYADIASDLSQQRQQAFEQASAIVEKSGGNMDKVPLSLRSQLSPEQNIALTHRAEQLTHPKEYGDSESYFHLLNLASLSAESRQQFAQENILSYTNLSPAQRTHLLTLQREQSLHDERAGDSEDRQRNQEAENEQRRQDHIAEDALRKAGKPDEADSLHAANVTKRDLKFHGPDNTAATAVAPTKPYNPLGGLLVPATPKIKITKQQIEDIGRKGAGYAQYLVGINVDVPKALLVPKEP